MQVQKIGLGAWYRSSSVAFKYMYGAATNAASLIIINITATSAAQLTDDHIGLRLRINNVNVTVGHAWLRPQMVPVPELASRS